MTKGVLPEKIEANNNEIGDVILATNIFVDSLKETANFANSIGEGNLTKEYAPLGKDDSLGHSLLEMREKLKVASEEDKIREWKIKGVTRFSELLRQNADDLELFGFNIISELTKSIGADQGAIFALEEGNEYNYLKMIGCYAFERRKYINKEVLKGEGIIGQCWQEKGSIHLKEIPQSYIKIKSGLGDSQPKEVLAVPLIEADEVFGIIEIASFKALDSYKIEYVQELCESIASTLKGIKINVQTQQLLTDSKKMTESMRSQEEELRQTAEEMQATTEDLEQRIREDKKESDEIIRNLKEKIRQLEGK
jgi:transcriptional regulator with GAF, ATPase, and Fis domain